MIKPASDILDHIEPGADFIIAGDSSKHFEITPMAMSPAPVPAGVLRYEQHTHCLEVVRQLDDPTRPSRRFERMRSLTDMEMMRRRQYQRIVIVTLDTNQRLYISRQQVDSVEEARAMLKDKYGHWLIVQFTRGCWLPAPEQMDPFTTDVPMAGSRVISGPKKLVGLFVDPGDTLVEWVFYYHGSGYYVVYILERCALADNGLQSTTEPYRDNYSGKRGDYYVFEQLADGSTPLVLITPDQDTAWQFLHNRPGRLLLTRWVDLVDMH